MVKGVQYFQSKKRLISNAGKKRISVFSHFADLHNDSADERAAHGAWAGQEDKDEMATYRRENYLSLEESGVASLNR